ncbi:MAG: hypothetical protein QNJ97_17695 [Myxococcota bacterium]|nr:hypothetical protein [Myxococcota bacterium]
MAYRDEIALLGSDLEEGENQYTSCPACGKPKFSVKREDGRILYRCFRNSCSLHGGGALQANGRRVLMERPRPRKQRIAPYQGALRELTEEEEQFLREKIGWRQWHLLLARPRYAEEQERFAFPIYSPMGRRRGWVLRSYLGREPKAKTRMDVEEPHLSWYTGGRSSSVLVVEDIPSAVRAARYVDAVAINGTGCGPDYINEIAAHKRNVIWALDNDATGQAIELDRRWGLLFDSSRVLMLDEDFKNMSEPALRTKLEEI